MIVFDPYPVIDPRGDLGPIANVTFCDVWMKVAEINLDDPQPPGYAYRLPLAQEYDPWIEMRDLVVSVEAYKPWEGDLDILLVAAAQQGISYYNQGLWHHVGGSVFSWCSDPLDHRGNRSIRGGSWLSDPRLARVAKRDSRDSNVALGYLGYRVVRGPRS